jgi:hypothetical protein
MQKQLSVVVVEIMIDDWIENLSLLEI